MDGWIKSIENIHDGVSSMLQQQAIAALEEGKVIFFPQLAFTLEAAEQKCLSPHYLDARTKNISFNPITGKLGGTHEQTQQALLIHLMRRFSETAHQWVLRLCPAYKTTLQIGRTSFRPAEILGRQTSYRKDDTRLHVDAFPSSPNQGRRILRVFSNINPDGKARVWRLGEPFGDMLDTFLPKIKSPLPGSSTLLRALRITKSRRTYYDHLMLQLHDTMKSDINYQRQVKQCEFSFPAQTTWMVFTDIASHAAMAGQYLLEQTFYLPVVAMKDQDKSPLRILEKRLKKRLVPS